MRRDVDDLVRAGLPIADSVARQIRRKLGGLIDHDELMSIARPAVLDAARSYDPSRAPFTPYVVMKVKWTILDEVRKMTRRRRVAARAAACAALERIAGAESDGEAEPAANQRALASEAELQAELSRLLARRAAAMFVSLVSVPDTDRHAAEPETPEDGLARRELGRDLRSAVRTLPERQRALVERHYFGDENFDVIAKDLGISKSWASRLHAQAMDALAEALRDSL